MEIESTTGSYYGEGTYLTWSAIDNGARVGELYVHPDTLVIMSIEVDEAHRGEGIARRLYETATASHSIKHAAAWACTEEGAGFAAALGGDIATDDDMARMGITTPEGI